jgi:hypothetical protein
MMTEEQPVGDLSDTEGISAGRTFDCEHQLMLLWRHTRFHRSGFAEREKFP